MRSVHDLHVWTVTSGFGALAAHVVVAPECDRDLVRRRLELLLHERFGIDHTTLQMEEEVPSDLLHVENAPGPGLIASPVARLIPCNWATSRLG